ncbi:uncharacterized protein LOC142795255 [Rhipicephalus microplus]|uniref:uncharacterized protein LOC142795255 n=1 Tax=Rhipicephalus microplus TaxID=6941 RepID=UPI003F6BDDE9
MVSEPKPYQANRKRQNLAPDPFATLQELGSPVKHARTEPLAFRAASAIGGGNKGIAKKKLHTYAKPDVLICGNYRKVFPSLQKLLDNKRHRCRLRFTCRCHVVGLLVADSPPGIPLPVCAQCLARCGSWWELASHLEATHGMSICHHASTGGSHKYGRARPEELAVGPGHGVSEQ